MEESAGLPATGHSKCNLLYMYDLSLSLSFIYLFLREWMNLVSVGSGQQKLPRSQSMRAVTRR